MRASSTVAALAALFAVASLLAAECRQRVAPDPPYLEAHERWRAERVAELTSESGWLTVVGLHWLEPGANSFGSAPTNRVPLSGAAVPPVAGSFELAGDGTVTVKTGPESGVTLGGEPVTERVLRPDRSGRPDVLALGSTARSSSLFPRASVDTAAYSTPGVTTNDSVSITLKSISNGPCT